MVKRSHQKDMMKKSYQKDMMKKSYQKNIDFGESDNPNIRLLELIKNESLLQRLPKSLCEGLALEETEIFTHLSTVTSTEQEVLGGILLDPLAIGRVEEQLSDYEFSIRSHQIIYDGCERLFKQGRVTDPMSVTIELSSHGQLERAGGQAGIAQLFERTMSAVNIDQLVELLIEKSCKNPINRDGSLKLWAAQEIAGATVREKTEAKAAILLEEIRKQAGMSVTRWTKFINPTIREAKRQRYREELRRILTIDDPLELSDEIQEICEVYRYSERKIQKDLATMERQTHTGQKRGIRPAIEYDEVESNPVPFLIPGLLPKGQSILLSGLSGTGKTIFALDLVEALLGGEPIYGFNPVKPCKVLLLVTDQPKWATMSYIRNKGIDTTNPNLMLWLRDDQRDDPGFTINDLLELRKGLEDFRPDFIVADSLRTIISHPIGISENDVLIGSYVSKVIQECTRFGSTLLMIHHDNKSTEQQGISKASGSGDIPARFDIHWQLSTPMGASYPQRDLKTGKTRSVMLDGRLNFDPDEFRFDLEHWNIESPEVSKSLTTTMNRIHHILQLNKNGLAIWQIQEVLNQAKVATIRTIRRCLAKMTEQLMIGRKKHPNHQRAFLYYLDKEPPSTTASTPSELPPVEVQEQNSTADERPTVIEKQASLALDKQEVKAELKRQLRDEFFSKNQIKKQDFIDQRKEYVSVSWIEEVIKEVVATGRFQDTGKLIKAIQKNKLKFKQGDQITYNGRYGVINRLAGPNAWWIDFNDSYIQEEINESDLEPYQ